MSAIVLLTGCGQQAASSSSANEDGDGTQPAGSTGPVSYAGSGRDRLCLSEAEGRAGLVIYGEGDANCGVRGTVQRSANRLTVTPEGDAACRIEAAISGDRLILGARNSACAYYCGPTANYAGKTFTRIADPEPAADLAGDPLC
ncbi:MAG TPA: hypothetical protein VM913_08240 [Sphingomicrobium sp.]|nr:hypothetical protein [Sphingomicrobium sp.]